MLFHGLMKTLLFIVLVSPLLFAERLPEINENPKAEPHQPRPGYSHELGAIRDNRTGQRLPDVGTGRLRPLIPLTASPRVEAPPYAPLPAVDNTEATRFVADDIEKQILTTLIQMILRGYGNTISPISTNLQRKVRVTDWDKLPENNVGSVDATRFMARLTELANRNQGSDSDLVLEAVVELFVNELVHDLVTHAIGPLVNRDSFEAVGKAIAERFSKADFTAGIFEETGRFSIREYPQAKRLLQKIDDKFKQVLARSEENRHRLTYIIRNDLSALRADSLTVLLRAFNEEFTLRMRDRR